MKKIFRIFSKKIPKKSMPIVLCVIMACILVYTINFRINASSFGGRLGTSAGYLAGKAIGSFEGMTVGRTEGTVAGKEEGLSAEDTAAEVANDIQQVENIEVLVANVKLSNFHQIGETDNPDYAALYLVNGSVVFSVDLSLADITSQGNSLYIVLPEPVGTLYLDDSSIEKVAEYQKLLFNGSAEDGFDEYLNTMAKMQEASEETLDNYDVLVSTAKEAAINQITLLVEAVSSQYDNVVIEWLE